MSYWDFLAREKSDRETYRAITPQGRSISQALGDAADTLQAEMQRLRRQHAHDQATIDRLREELAARTRAARESN